MSKLKKRDAQYSFLTPRQSRKDTFKVYDKPFLGNKQFEAIQQKKNERTIHIDPEVVYRMATLGLDRKMVAGYYGMSPAKFGELCEMFPIIEEVFLMGATAGVLANDADPDGTRLEAKFPGDGSAAGSGQDQPTQPARRESDADPPPRCLKNIA